MTTNNLILAHDGKPETKEVFNRVANFPAVNIAETKDNVQLVLEIPGYRHEDVAVHFMQTRLFVSGSRNENYFDKTKLHLQTERIASFRCVYDLKIPFSKKDLAISLENGFMFITILKTEKKALPSNETAIIENYMEDNFYFPRANVVETENHLEMSLEIPGYRNEDVSIKIINESLTIKGKRNLLLFDQSLTYKRVEIPFRNTFIRKFELPENVNKTQASWNVKEGVLYVYLPKLKTIRKEEVMREAMAY
jgi:HSP20 family protein